MAGGRGKSDLQEEQTLLPFDLVYQDPDGWPDTNRFPVNWAGDKVGKVVENDLLETSRPLIITGYSSLEKVIAFLAHHKDKKHSKPDVRLLFGHEPQLAGLDHAHRLEPLPLSDEMRDYWLEQNVNPLQIVNLFDALEYVRRGNVNVRFPRANSPMMHSKIYVAQEASTLGSSNFTGAGFGKNIEGNVRFPNGVAKFWKKGLDQLAERHWEQGVDGTEKFIELLEKLQREVNWETALARACAELLGDEWLKENRERFGMYQGHRLWPSQEEGIARALCVLRTSGAVLVADAAGSGKTKTGAHLLRHLTHGLWAESQARKDVPVLITPPDSVKESWELELIECGVSAQVHSYGLLSRGRDSKRELIQKALQRGYILAIDEAHRFYGRDAERARQVRNNLADYVMLFTATPINRGIQDLVSLINLLGADNISESTHKVLESLWKAKSVDRFLETLSEEEIKKLRREIRNFTVRRTQAQLAKRIEKEPNAYRDRLGRKCRYPIQKTDKYQTSETGKDKAAAKEIMELADSIKGIHFFKSELAVPEGLRKDNETDEGYLKKRLNSAKALTKWIIAESLRSSRAALIEHLEGTETAIRQFGIQGHQKSEGGNIMKSVREMKGPPKSSLTAKLPRWLEKQSEFALAQKEELQILRKIADLTMKMSDAREHGKARLLADKASGRTRVLAFDRHPITLHVIASYVKRESEALVHVVGSSKRSRREAEEICSLEKQGESAVVLCSNALSEGVNLQGASIMAHLDFPSVIRIAEQRAGRIMRMDSPHKEISVLWPDDSGAFNLKSTEEKLIARHRLTTTLLGANIELPFGRAINDPMAQDDKSTGEEKLDEIQDVFESVESLVEGKRAIIPTQLYQKMRGSEARVVSAVSIIESRKGTWAFLCIRGGRFRPPRWVYMQEEAGVFETSLINIAEHLREHFGGNVKQLKFQRNAAQTLNQFMQTMRDKEEDLLPPLKQRALKQMRVVLKKLSERSRNDADPKMANWIDKIIGWLTDRNEEDAPDISALADAWLSVIQPTWTNPLKEKKGRRPLRLMDRALVKKLTGDKAPTAVGLQRAFSSIPNRSTNENRLAAAIIGIPEST